MLKAYLKRIYEVAQTGDAREESYYSSLEELLKVFAHSIDKKHIHITTLPKKTEAGNPDFRVWDGKQSIVGYIEAKEPLAENLDYIENGKQLKRYRHTFPNLILTNFFEFRLYRNGRLVDKALLARPFIIHQLKTVPPVENRDGFLNLLNKFLSFSLPKAYTAESLAVELAKRTSFLKEQVIVEELKEERSSVLGFYEAFQKYLIAGLTQDGFADLYAQTITYGLFAARTRCKNGFNRKLAYDYIPRTIGILRDVFSFISLEELPKQMEWIVDEISQVLAVADVNEILDKFYHEAKGRDPVYYFYETFLAKYNPEERERRGVYYTPESVVSYIVRSLDIILKERFDRPDGFASNSVTVLDPAAGTLTFPAEASKLALEQFTAKYGKGGKESFIKEHILKNFYAFELMMAPYALGHLKMALLLEEVGYKLEEDERFKFYLTNTLEMEELEQTVLPGMASLAEESHLAGKVKKEEPILVILGNPPYSGISANLSERKVTVEKGNRYVTNYQIQEDKLNGCYKLIPQTKEARRKMKIKQKTWIGELIEHYKVIDGQWLGERKQWLQDDYVKFIRFAQWKIDQAGEGVLGFITNHSYLDNPTFRGMRQSLMNSFNELYLLDLHGNSLKRERCPDGSKDENVFDIQQGVAISLFIKRKGLEKKVFHSELWGLQKDKYDWLLGNDVNTIEWQQLKPDSPYYFFVPRAETYRNIYEKFWKITDVFPINCVGIVTARDKFVIDFDRDVLKRQIVMFRNLSMPDELIKQAFKLKDTSTFKFRKSRETLSKDKNWDKYFTQISYRPFDKRNIYYTNIVVERPLLEVMHHMMRENLGLLTCRQNTLGFHHAFICENIVESCVVSNKTREISYLFPLYLYLGKGDMFNQEETRRRKPNLNLKLVESLAEAYGKEPTPEEIFYYIYSILYSNIYRSKYAEFLKIDFPRVPFTKDHELFNRIGKCGSKLVDLHLMKSAELNNPITKFQGSGDNQVEKPTYHKEDNRVYINDDQYFERIEKEVWEYQIGGYQVLDKWLKDRKGRKLSLEEIKHYCQITTALKKTMEVQQKIDSLYADIEKETIEISR
ncbi:MAG: N-6 DNA methylase [Dehalococcoidia bacterium]|nr:N-6 DNA methylase [Dehalococcoidia bacterium]